MDPDSSVEFRLRQFDNWAITQTMRFEYEIWYIPYPSSPPVINSMRSCKFMPIHVICS